MRNDTRLRTSTELTDETAMSTPPSAAPVPLPMLVTSIAAAMRRYPGGRSASTRSRTRPVSRLPPTSAAPHVDGDGRGAAPLQGVQLGRGGRLDDVHDRPVRGLAYLHQFVA